MRSIQATVLFLSALLFHLALGAPIERAGPIDIVVRTESSLDKALQFRVPCLGCSESNTGADESLVLSLSIPAGDPTSLPGVAVNGQSLFIRWPSLTTEGAQTLLVENSSSGRHSLHSLHLNWFGTSAGLPHRGHTKQYIHFNVTQLNSLPITPLRFAVRMGWEDDFSWQWMEVIPDSDSGSNDFQNDEDLWTAYESTEGTEMDRLTSSENHDIEDELDALALLEAQAVQLQAQITDKKSSISKKLKQEREQLCLKHLLKECDGVMCKAQAIVQRLCDKMGISTDPSFGYKKLPQDQMSVMGGSDSNQAGFHINSVSAKYATEHETSRVSAFNVHPGDFVKPQSTLARVLECVFAVLGLTALFRFIKRRCASARSKADRAADLEQRRNERAYRRAARRALMRKRWDNLTKHMSCFRAKDEPRVEDYEEKRALILQDAFLEQGLDQAEKGEVMEAEIRELRHAHEIISSLVRVDEYRTPRNDPPPPLVPLPYTPASMRSRASTNTLPSYTSESLPGYTSRRPSTHRRDSGSTAGSEPSSSDIGGRATPGPSLTENSGSSVIEVSTRPSGETLRTRQSGDAHYR